MKNTLTAKVTVLAWLMLMATILPFVSCKEKEEDKCKCPKGTVHTYEEGKCKCGGDGCDKNCTVAQPTHSFIAFSKTVNVIGDASIPVDDWNVAKNNLETAMKYLDEEVTGDTARGRYANMLNCDGFKIIIETGNAGPEANADKSMTIGVTYLINSDATSVIAVAINNKVAADNAFAMLNARDGFKQLNRQVYA
jgi:hypothetical protein